MTPQILIADRSAFMRDVVRDIVTGAGFFVCGEAKTGQEALSFYQQLQPDMVIVDLVMPEFSGLDTIRLIKAHDPHAKILICSSIRQPNYVFSALQAGVGDYITKPFQPSGLLRGIQNVLGPGDGFQQVGLN